MAAHASPDQVCAVFDVLLERAQELPDEAIPYFLALVEGQAESIYESMTEAIRVATGTIRRPEDAPLACRFYQALDAGDKLTAAALFRWLTEETKSMPLVLAAKKAAVGAEVFLASVSANLAQGQEAHNQRTGVPA